ncbi:MAG: hypothetical protein HY819_21840 [Acidobacteria bacterium]|nr:hypothetical protein [Acidobacteriota bacterium]
MSELITWILALFIIIGAFWALTYDYQYKQSRTVEQYKKDLDKQGITGEALARTGLLELEKFLKPNLAAAIQQLEDEKQGQTKTKKQGDDGDDESDESDKNQIDQKVTKS